METWEMEAEAEPADNAQNDLQKRKKKKVLG